MIILAMILGLAVAMGGLGTACWAIWLLHRHWPHTEHEIALELAKDVFAAYRSGWQHRTPTTTLEEIDAELARAIEETSVREAARRRAKAMLSPQQTPPPDRDDSMTVAEFGTEPT